VTQDWIPYGRQSINDDDIAAVGATLKSEWLTTGPAVESFETALAGVTGSPTIAVSSGTAALHAAYFAAGVGPGTEVIVPPLTFVATAAAAVHLGATIRFADVRSDTLNLDPEAVTEMATAATKVISPVDYAGHPADLDEIMAIASEIGAMVMEDASHSLGATYRGRKVGSIADLTVFSFHPVKLITTGEGGAIASTDAGLLDHARRFRNHGLVRDTAEHLIPDQGEWHQEVHLLGLNYRLPDPLAALGESQLNRLGSFQERRSHLAGRYTQLLSSVEGIELPITLAGSDHGWHLYVIRVKEGRRREVFDKMRANGIGVQVHYLPVHLHPAFADQGYQRGMCPVAEQAYEEVLSLPLYPDLTEEMQDRVVAELDSALA
jgi:perosamine synthetase